MACFFVFVSLHLQWFSWLDRLIYDNVVKHRSATLDPRIVIIGIDDASLDRFGPWPWPRTLQAQLLTRLAEHNPAVVALDIIYAGETATDTALVQAAAATPELALPLMVERLRVDEQHVEVLPFPALAEQADILGHIHVELDDDAITRGTYLYQGVGQPHWPHLMAAIATQLTNQPLPPCLEPSQATLFITKCRYVGVPFAGPSGTYPIISAAMLLDPDDTATNSHLLSQSLVNKTVLVGLTAAGVGDRVTSPVSGDHVPMSGVEFNANLLSALIHQQTIQPLGGAVPLLFACLLVIVCSLCLPRLKPGVMIMTTAVIAFTAIVVSAVLLASTWLHLPVASAAITVAGIYPVWSWRRHEIAWQFIQSELQRIDTESATWAATDASGGQQLDTTTLLENLNALLDSNLDLNTLAALDLDNTSLRPTPLSDAEAALLADAKLTLTQPQEEQTRLPGEMLAAQISQLKLRAKEVREGRSVGLAGLGRMSAGVMIISALGQLRFLNAAAVRVLTFHEPANETLAFAALERITPPLGQTWRDIMRRVVLQQEAIEFEGHTPTQQPVYISAAPLSDFAEQGAEAMLYAPYWVVTLSDLSAIKTAQAQREEALAFLSHDIRSPLTSVLALIHNNEDASPLLNKIANYTQKSLSTSEQFLQLSRLELQDSFEMYDVAIDQVIYNAVEQVFFLSQEKNIEINLLGALQESFETQDAEPIPDPGAEPAADPMWLVANGELIERALVNLLGNAIKYSENNNHIDVILSLDRQSVSIDIKDYGHGIPADEIEHIFAPFFRSSKQQLAVNRGAGLGLRFVKTVAEKHAGSISVDSTWEQGSTFTLRLPRGTPTH